MARIEWVEYRLQNWARWVLARGDSGGLGYSRIQLGQPEAGRRSLYVETKIPINDVEASATDDAVDRLYPPGLSLTVREFYTGRGGIADKARRLCCAESTIYARIDAAHRQLADALVDQQRRAKQERERVEALQAPAKPGGFTP